MANGNSKILTEEQELKLRKPIEDHVGKIQEKIDSLRVDGTEKVVHLQGIIDRMKKDRSLTKGEKENRIQEAKRELEKAKAVEAKNKDQISKLISEAEAYLKEHFNKDYYNAVLESCAQQKVQAKENYKARLVELEKEHQGIVAKLSDHNEIKDEKYVYKNRLFDAKIQYQKELQEIKDRRHAAYNYKYHLIDLLRMSKFTFLETRATEMGKLQIYI